MTQLSDLNPSNTFELQLLDVLKGGVPSSGVSEGAAAAIDKLIDKSLSLEARVADLERRLEAVMTAIKEEAGAP